MADRLIDLPMIFIFEILQRYQLCVDIHATGSVHSFEFDVNAFIGGRRNVFADHIRANR